MCGIPPSRLETSVMPSTLPPPATSLLSLCPAALLSPRAPDVTDTSLYTCTDTHFPSEIWGSSVLVSLAPPQRIFLKHVTLHTDTHPWPSLSLESDPRTRWPNLQRVPTVHQSVLHKQLCEADAVLHPHFKLEKLKVQRGSEGWHSKQEAEMGLEL